MKNMISGLATAFAFLFVAVVCPPVSARLMDAYPTPGEMDEEIRQMAEAHSGLVELIEYGRSVEGRPLLALRFHRGDGMERPGGLVAGNIHGEEWIGNRAAMAVADRIASGLDNDPFISDVLSRMDIYIIPCINPDGYYRTWASGGVDSPGEMRKNAHGVDLNRNFPPPEGRGGNRAEQPSSPVYAGPEPLSEPETKSVVDFVLERNIIALVSYHSVLGVFGTPTCYNAKCVARYEKMCWAHSRNQKSVHYMWMVLPGISGREWYPGQMEPYLYHQHGVMAILVELGIQPVNTIQNRSRKTFEVFNPKNPDFWAGNEAEAAIHALEAARRATGGRPVPPDER